MTTFYLTLRILNVALYCGILSGVIMHWRQLPDIPEMPGFRWSMLTFIAASSYATIESSLMGLPGGPRLIPITLSLIGLFFSCYATLVRRHIANRRTMAHKRADRKP